jgi:DNA-binding transcriptional LysR family regulator
MRKQSASLDDLGHMAAFVLVVESRSFSAAARSLGTTTSAVSKRVARLEERLGVRLLARTTRTLSLTEPGAALFERASGILRDIESAEIEVARHSSAPRGKLRVTAPRALSESRVVPALGRFLSRYPEVSVELSVNDRFVDVVAERYDVALRVGNTTAEGLVVRRLGTERAVVAASPAYLASHGSPASPEDLLQHDCLLYTLVPPRHEWRFTDRRGERAIPVAGRFSSDHSGALLAMALQGLGIVWMPHFIIERELGDGRLVQLLERWETPTYPVQAVLASGRSPLPKVKAFIDFLAGELRPATRG